MLNSKLIFITKYLKIYSEPVPFSSWFSIFISVKKITHYYNTWLHQAQDNAVGMDRPYIQTVSVIVSHKLEDSRPTTRTLLCTHNFTILFTFFSSSGPRSSCLKLTTDFNHKKENKYFLFCCQSKSIFQIHKFQISHWNWNKNGTIVLPGEMRRLNAMGCAL